MLRLEVMISALPDRSISYFISLWFVVVSRLREKRLPPHSFYCTEQKKWMLFFRQHSIGVSRIFIRSIFTLSPTATSATSSCDNLICPKGFACCLEITVHRVSPSFARWLMPQLFPIPLCRHVGFLLRYLFSQVLRLFTIFLGRPVPASSCFSPFPSYGLSPVRTLPRFTLSISKAFACLDSFSIFSSSSRNFFFCGYKSNS